MLQNGQVLMAKRILLDMECRHVLRSVTDGEKSR